LTGKVKSGEPLDQRKWKDREVLEALDTHVDLKWCSYEKDRVKELESLAASIRRLERKKEEVVRTIITRTPGLRQFMCVHSVFSWDDKEDRDWFVSTVVDEVVMSDREIHEMRAPQRIPVEIMEKFSMFDPRPVGYEFHPIRIEYKFRGNPRYGESRDPVNIIFTQWDDEDVPTESQISDFIKEQGIIKL